MIVQPVSASLAAFLAALTPNLSALGQAMADSGVRTEEDLVGLASLSKDVWHQFCVGLDFTLFQETILWGGLMQMYAPLD